MLEAAIDLMRQSGLSGAGINNILKVSGGPKGSMYHHFPNGKDQIVGEAITIYAGRVQATIGAALDRGRTPGEKIRGLFDALARRMADGDFKRSCAVAAVTLDMDESAALHRPLLDGTLSAWIDEVACHLPAPSSARTRSFAGLVVSTVEGAYVRARAGGSARPLIEAGLWLSELAEQALGVDAEV